MSLLFVLYISWLPLTSTTSCFSLQVATVPVNRLDSSDEPRTAYPLLPVWSNLSVDHRPSDHLMRVL